MLRSLFRSVSLQSLLLPALVGALAFATGCAPTLSPPFDQMKSSAITVYRLQNYEPPPQAGAAAGAAVPGLPPQLQQWVTAGASLLPPGLIPPGLIPGAPGAAAPAADQTQRFHGFRILGYSALNDKAQREEALGIFGSKSSFSTATANCLYAEFGFSFAAPTGGPPADVLVSLSCNQVKAEGFAWPHGAQTGLTADTSKRIIAIAQKVFGG
ncbi:MAG TPA: hypothetical protein PLR99_25575 [Polyangiaceae bacterium]|nr:hypothetical protein [Polyangiaceae bacterium]